MVVSVLRLVRLARLARLVSHKLILVLEVCLCAEEALVSEIEAGASPGSKAEEESEEEERSHHTQSGPSPHPQCLGDRFEVFRGNISGDDDITVRHAQ